MIELTCPGCKKWLELDEGFGGGACRCSGCGKLVAVPRPRGRRRNGASERPDAPEPAENAGFPAAPTFHEPEAAAFGSGTTPAEQQAEPIASPAGPRARRRFLVRLTVMACAVLTLGLIGIAIYAVSLLAEPAPPSPDRLHAELAGIDGNPFLMSEPSFMGVPIGSSAVLMADSSAAMREHLDLVKQAILRAVETLEPRQHVQVALWREPSPVLYPREPRPARELDRTELKARLDGVYAAGAISARPAFTAALQSKPERVILVARLLPEELLVRSIGRQIDQADARLIAVLIDHSSPLLERIAEESGGRVIEITGSQLQRWYGEYLDQKAEAGGQKPEVSDRRTVAKDQGPKDQGIKRQVR